MSGVGKVAIVGGGLVGALNACFLAKRGYEVDLYELRPDIRGQEHVKGRSINLALSCRGREALKAIGMEEKIVASGIPMYARMIHNTDGSTRPIPYGTADQYIMSVDRRLLNEVLLTAAEENQSVTLHFKHKFNSCNFDTGDISFINAEGETVNSKVDLIIGNDGAFSSVRKSLMKATRFDFNQEYIPHGYMELCIPGTNGEFTIPKNYLHIWPRNEFMMIGLPNTEDKSFVMTLFMPFDIFESIKTEKDLLEFFENTFPDSVPLIGRKSLIDSFFKSKALPMVSVKCSPYHVGDKCVIMGDAAHAMVPFYGQGMNCGFEDCLVFDGIMEKHNNDLSKVLPEFTEYRNIDAKAMCDLALYNYIEMRSSVNSKLFLLRKKLDNFLYWIMPNTWVPLYTMVSFTRTRYHQCIAKRQWQDQLLTNVVKCVGLGLLLSGSFLGWKTIQNHGDLLAEMFKKN